MTFFILVFHVGAFLQSFSPNGGPFSPCGVLFCHLFSVWGASFVLMRSLFEYQLDHLLRKILNPFRKNLNPFRKNLNPFRINSHPPPPPKKNLNPYRKKLNPSRNFSTTTENFSIILKISQPHSKNSHPPPHPFSFLFYLFFFFKQNLRDYDNLQYLKYVPVNKHS